jgi:hypothetical protein
MCNVIEPDLLAGENDPDPDIAICVDPTVSCTRMIARYPGAALETKAARVSVLAGTVAAAGLEEEPPQAATSIASAHAAATIRVAEMPRFIAPRSVALRTSG